MTGREKQWIHMPGNAGWSMNIKVIMNPKAGKGRALRIWQQTEKLLSALPKGQLAWTCYHSRGPEQTCELSGQAEQDGFDAVMVVGGDGTVGDAARGCLEHRLPLIIVPAGTGNACARSLGLSNTRDALTQLLRDGEIVDLDAGMIGNAFFLNMAGVGFDADVLNQYKKSGWARGIPGYIGVGLGMLNSYQAAKLTITDDRGTQTCQAAMVAVCNGPYYGGGLLMAPQANMQDGLLDICLLEDLAPKDYLAIWQGLYTGRHLRHPKVRVFQTSRLVVESDQPLRYHRDGDLAGSTPCEIRVLSGAIRVLIPKGRAQSIKGE